MKEPKELNINNKDSDLCFAHLDDTKQCYVRTSSYGEITSTTISKTQAERVVNWLNKWIEFKETA